PCFNKDDCIGGNFKSYAGIDLANSDDLMSVVRYYEVMAEKLGIAIKLNTEVNPKLMRSVLHQYDVGVAAARVKCGHRVVVLGAGKIGLTVAESLKTRGHEVTIVESAKRIAGDVQPSFKWRHTAWGEDLKIER